MPQVFVVVPGSIDARTGGSIYDRRMVDGLRTRGWVVDVHEANAADRQQDIFGAIPDGALVLADGLVYSARPELAERHAPRLRFVALVHMPLAEEPGLAPDRAARLEAGERRALGAAAATVVTGPHTAGTVARYGIRRDRIFLIAPGTDRWPLARGSRGEAVQLLTVATVNAGKGHAVLVRALGAIPHRGWRLTCAGSLDRDPPAVSRLRALIRSSGLEDRITLSGELDAAGVQAAYDNADVFVLPTLHETFGMAVAEAIAHGLPVVSTSAGAIPDLVGDGGLVVPPGDEGKLRTALAQVISDPSLRARLAAGARAARERLPSWDAAFDRMSAVLTAVAGDGRVAL